MSGEQASVFISSMTTNGIRRGTIGELVANFEATKKLAGKSLVGKLVIQKPISNGVPGLVLNKVWKCSKRWNIEERKAGICGFHFSSEDDGVLVPMYGHWLRSESIDETCFAAARNNCLMGFAGHGKCLRRLHIGETADSSKSIPEKIREHGVRKVEDPAGKVPSPSRAVSNCHSPTVKPTESMLQKLQKAMEDPKRYASLFFHKTGTESHRCHNTI